MKNLFGKLYEHLIMKYKMDSRDLHPHVYTAATELFYIQ